MSNTFRTGIAALLAVTTMATAMPASAQYYGGDRDGRYYRDSDRDGRPDYREWNRDRDRDGRPDQWDRRDNRRDWRRDWRSDRRHDRQYRYYGGNYGYDGYYGRWRSGQRYPYWRDNRYYIRDYHAYGLPAPYRGYRYYRTDSGDIVMAAVASGIIGVIIGNAIAR
jgi:Ni/Co efflux regulator RcnB